MSEAAPLNPAAPRERSTPQHRINYTIGAGEEWITTCYYNNQGKRTKWGLGSNDEMSAALHRSLRRGRPREQCQRSQRVAGLQLLRCVLD